MSADLYSTGLWWSPGRGGLAKLHGRAVKLTEPPVIGANPVYLLAYVPETGLRWLHALSQEPRDMWPAEIAQADALLASLCAPETSP